MPNYRNVYKSDHLGVVDLEELTEQNKPLIFTISQVKQEQTVVAGSKGNFNIAYFKEKIKPLVLNSTNASTIRKLGKFGTDVDTWVNIPVELYIDSNVKMKGQIVGGVRIKQTSPIIVPQISDVNALSIVESSKTLDELKSNWEKLTPAEKNLPTVLAKKESLKTTLNNGSIL